MTTVTIHGTAACVQKKLSLYNTSLILAQHKQKNDITASLSERRHTREHTHAHTHVHKQTYTHAHAMTRPVTVYNLLKDGNKQRKARDSRIWRDWFWEHSLCHQRRPGESGNNSCEQWINNSSLQNDLLWFFFFFDETGPSRFDRSSIPHLHTSNEDGM